MLTINLSKTRNTKRPMSAYRCFMRENRQFLKIILGEFNKSHPELPLLTKIHLLRDTIAISGWESLNDEKEILLEKAEYNLYLLKSTDSFSEWCFRHKVPEKIPKDANKAYLKKQEFKGHNIFTNTTKLGILLWLWRLSVISGENARLKTS